MKGGKSLHDIKQYQEEVKRFGDLIGNAREFKREIRIKAVPESLQTFDIVLTLNCLATEENLKIAKSIIGKGEKLWTNK